MACCVAFEAPVVLKRVLTCSILTVLFSKDSEKQLKDIKDMEGNFMKIVSKHKDKEDILKKIETIKKMDISQLNEFVNAHRRNQ